MNEITASDCHPIVWQPDRHPRGWHIIDKLLDGVRAVDHASGLRVIVSAMATPDGLRWAHLSASLARRMPTWPELISVRDAWLGDVEAYQVAPPRDRYVDIHPFTLHLWTCLDEPAGVLPRFEAILDDGRRSI